MENRTSSLGQDIYTGVAAVGRVKAIISLIGMLILFLILVAVIAYLLYQRQYYSGQTTGTLQAGSCTLTGTQYECTFQVSYSVNGQPYQQTIRFTDQQDHQTGQAITLYYSPNQPQQVVTDVPSISLIWILVGLALLILIIGVISTYLTLRYKPLAAVSGASYLFQSLY